jgi:hypothetical protein
VVGAASGSFAPSAREEYPIFSNQLPSFDYTSGQLYLGVRSTNDFATGGSIATGPALSLDGEHIFAAERQNGKIVVL